jgi:hypothetical protein
VISVDDACAPFFAPDPSRCGVGLFSAWNTQLMHQPSWTLFDVIKLAGVQPRADGYRIAPSLPLSRFSVRLPQVGVAYEPRVARGYVRPAGPRTVRMTIELPARGEARRARAYVEGRSVPATCSGRSGRGLVFTLRARRGAAIDWAVVA